MRTVYLISIVFLINMCVSAGGAFGAEGDAGAATAAVVVGGGAATGTVSEREATVVMVKDSAVMLDKGIRDGLMEGMVVPLYYGVSEGAANAAGTGSLKVADVSIVQSEEHICLGILVSAESPAAKGMKVRYGAYADEGAGGEYPADAAPKGPVASCPEGMQAVSGGEFVWKAGSRDSDEKVDSAEVVETTGDFCVDVEAGTERVKWADAVAECAARGLHLCSMAEQHKMCLKHSKRPPCVKETPGQVCPRGTALEDYGPQLEWSASWTEESRNEPGVFIVRTGSCSCNAGTGGCSVCYYPECGGSAKKYRCCLDLK